MRGTLINPAASLTPISPIEIARISLATVTLLAPIRLVFISFLLLIGWCLTRIFRGNYESLVFRFILRFGVRLILLIAGFYWIPVRGSWDHRASIIVSTHHSIWDSLILIYQVGASLAAKADLFNQPILRDFLSALRSFPVDRHSREGREKALDAIQRRACNSACPPIVVFSTAICTNCRQLSEFKRGAFEPGMAIQPVGIAYLGRNTDLKLSRWMLWDLYRTLSQAVNFVAVTILPIRYPSEGEKRAPYEWAEKVRCEMGDQLGMTLSPYCLELEIIRTKCRDRGIPFNESKLHGHRQIRINLDKVLHKFMVLDRDKDGYLSQEDLGAKPGDFHQLLRDAKIKGRCPDQDPPNYEAWTDRGWIGLITGGRPRLFVREEDKDPREALEFSEVLVFMDKMHKGQVPMFTAFI